MEREKKNLTLSGSGSAPGGVYEDVRINGSGKIEGNIVCDHIDINGSSRVLGDVKASSVTISGSAVVEKKLIAESVVVNGSFKVEGDFTGEQIEVNGHTKILGTLHSERLRINGILTVAGALEAEELTSEGQLTVGGLCSAERIDITLSGLTSRVKEVGCGTLTVHRRLSSSLFGSLLSVLKMGKLIVDTIEGDDLYLEDTEAQIVRGNRVRIGPGCTIGKVMYQSDYEKDEKATVQSAVKE